MISRSSSVRLSRIRSSTHHRKSCRPQRLIKRDQKQVQPFPACHSWARWTPIQNFTACAVYRSKPKVWSQNHNNMLHLPKHAQCTVRLFSGSSQCQGGKCKYLTGGSKQSPFWRSWITVLPCSFLCKSRIVVLKISCFFGFLRSFKGSYFRNIVSELSHYGIQWSQVTLNHDHSYWDSEDYHRQPQNKQKQICSIPHFANAVDCHRASTYEALWILDTFSQQYSP